MQRLPSLPRQVTAFTLIAKTNTWHFHTNHLSELTSAIQSVIRLQEEPTDDTDLLIAQQIIGILTLICTEANEIDSADTILSDKLKNILHYLDDRSVKQSDLMKKHNISRNTLKKYIDLVKAKPTDE